MNKLREKLRLNVFSAKYGKYATKEIVNELEQITDDFSVKFAEWKDKLQLESKIGLMDRGFSVYMESGKEPIEITTTELLQIFKDKHYE